MLRLLAKSVRQYKKETLLSSLFVAMEVVMEVLIPFFMARLIDRGISAGDMNYILRLGSMLLLFALTSLTFGALSGYFASTASNGFAANLRRDIFAAIQSFAFPNIDRFSSASLVTRLTTDINNLTMAYQAIIRQAVRSVSMAAFSLAMALRTNARVALVFAGVAPLLGFGLIFIAIKAHPFFRRALKTYDKLNNVVQENLQGVRVVKAYAREAEEEQKFGHISAEVYRRFSAGQKRVAFNMPLIQLSTYACILLISWLGAGRIAAGGMSTGELMSMFAYTMQILMNLMMLSIVFVQIIIARSSAQRAAEVLREQPSLRSPAHPLTQVRDGSVEFREVDFSYVNDESKLCLAGANLAIAAGETIGILGGTGSSKTSLVQLIPRLYDVTRGAVLVGGADVRNYDIEALRGAVAMVLQKNVLFSGTIAENLRWGNPEATDAQLREACRLAQADEFIMGFPEGYNTHIEEGGTNVSGGQRQRLCIARALLKRPKILILDDSTSAVDTKTDALIRQAFREVIPGTTKLIIAQRVTSVMDADRIVVMDGGRIHAVGTHEQLLQSNGIYREIYQTQVQGGGDFDE
ncbi:MAG: ABC transporter ATP-binding protein/permease [Oscillospiraceae bacterium]|jgi:ATP-binding cassette subfamily B protein|nr:ABC transporter ATP-binding protein/permease [Oscillospiraceae bacterium]